jgi:hypothetical protein
MGLDMEAVNKPSNVLLSRVDGSFVHTFHGADEKLDRFTTAGLITSTFFPLSFFSPLDLVCVQVQFTMLYFLPTSLLPLLLVLLATFAASWWGHVG